MQIRRDLDRDPGVAPPCGGFPAIEDLQMSRRALSQVRRYDERAAARSSDTTICFTDRAWTRCLAARVYSVARRASANTRLQLRHVGLPNARDKALGPSDVREVIVAKSVPHHLFFGAEPECQHHEECGEA